MGGLRHICTPRSVCCWKQWAGQKCWRVPAGSLGQRVCAGSVRRCETRWRCRLPEGEAKAESVPAPSIASPCSSQLRIRLLAPSLIATFVVVQQDSSLCGSPGQRARGDSSTPRARSRAGHASHLAWPVFPVLCLRSLCRWSRPAIGAPLTPGISRSGLHLAGARPEAGRSNAHGHSSSPPLRNSQCPCRRIPANSSPWRPAKDLRRLRCPV